MPSIRSPSQNTDGSDEVADSLYLGRVSKLQDHPGRRTSGPHAYATWRCVRCPRRGGTCRNQQEARPPIGKT
eukprot:10917623-Heterocapsa_arctica.AAC.1